MSDAQVAEGYYRRQWRVSLLPQGVVYIVEAGTTGRVKIGFTSGALAHRISTLQIGNFYRLRVLVTFPGTAATEADLHAAFAPYWLRGEWFAREGRLEVFLRLALDEAHIARTM